MQDSSILSHKVLTENLVKKLVIIASGLIALSCSLPALATMSVPNGWYIEGNVGATRVSDKNYGGSANTSNPGFSLDLGYKFMPYLGMELGYTLYSNTTVKVSGTKAGTDKHYSFDVAAKGILPITDSGFEPFAKLGVARISTRSTVNDDTLANSIGFTSGNRSATGAYLGAGAQYYFLPELAGVLQWSRVVGNHRTGTLDFYSVGISFLVD